MDEGTRFLALPIYLIIVVGAGTILAFLLSRENLNAAKASEERLQEAEKKSADEPGSAKLHVIAKEIEVSSNGILSFHVRDDSQSQSSGWGYFPRLEYLDINGAPAYLIGNRCGTCAATFKRVSSSLPMTPRQLSDNLENGIETVSQEIMDTVSALLPRGKYIVSIIQMRPSLVRKKMWPLMMSVFCESDYCWLRRIAEYKNPSGCDNEIILPLVSEAELSPARVEYYSQKMRQGLHPTALSLSVIDERTLRGENPVWQLAHFLLDGHHKVMAASKIGMPISILSFLFMEDSDLFCSVSRQYVLNHAFIRKHYNIE